MIYNLVVDGEPTNRLEVFDTAPQLTGKPAMQWLEWVDDQSPDYDPETHKLGEVSRFVEGGSAVWRRSPVALTADELHQRKIAKIAETDNSLIRGIEDIIVLIADGKPINKSNIPPSLLEKVNARRILRGLEPI